MPIFRYKCPKCGLEQKLLVPRFDAPVKCSGCGTDELEKLPSAFAAVAKSAASGCPSADFCPSAGGHCCGGNCGCGH